MWPSEPLSRISKQLPFQRLILGPAEDLPGWSGDGRRDSFGGILLQSTAKLSGLCREDGARLSTELHSGRRMRGNKVERWESKIRIMEKK